MHKTSNMLQSIIDDASDILRPDANYELSDIDVEEVSIVDHAANKRRFLIIKNRGVDMGGKKEEVSKEGFSLKSETKAAAAAALSESLGYLVKVAESVKGSTEAEDGAALLPNEILKSLQVVSKGISKLLIAHSVEKGVSELAEVLVTVSESTLSLAEEIAVDGEVKEDVVAKMAEVSDLMSAVMKKLKGEEAPAEVDTDKNAEPGTGATSEVEEEPAVEEVDTDKNSEIDPAIKTLMESVAQTNAAVAALAQSMQTMQATTKAEEVKEESDLAKQLAAVQKSLEARDEDLAKVRAALDAINEAPPSRVSGTQTAPTGVAKNSGRVIFPEEYNNPIFDPEPAN